METVRVMGFKTEKRIENEAYWAADQQRIDEVEGMKECKRRLLSHQKFLKILWEEKRIKKIKESSPGPLDYQNPNSNFVSTFQRKDKSYLKEYSYSFGKAPR